MILKTDGASRGLNSDGNARTEPLLRNATQAAAIFNRDNESHTVVRGIYTART